jgi:hypothetical protein
MHSRLDEKSLISLFDARPVSSVCQFLDYEVDGDAGKSVDLCNNSNYSLTIAPNSNSTQAHK